MKNFFKLFGVIALVAVIGFSMTACDDGGGGGEGITPSGITAVANGGYFYGHILINGFDVVKDDSTLPDFTGINPSVATNWVGFSVTVDGKSTMIGSVQVVRTTDNWQIYIRLVDSEYKLAAGVPVNVSYTPDGKNEFVNTSGKALSSFSLNTFSFNSIFSLVTALSHFDLRFV